MKPLTRPPLAHPTARARPVTAGRSQTRPALLSQTPAVDETAEAGDRRAPPSIPPWPVGRRTLTPAMKRFLLDATFVWGASGEPHLIQEPAHPSTMAGLVRRGLWDAERFQITAAGVEARAAMGGDIS